MTVANKPCVFGCPSHGLRLSAKAVITCDYCGAKGPDARNYVPYYNSGTPELGVAATLLWNARSQEERKQAMIIIGTRGELARIAEGGAPRWTGATAPPAPPAASALHTSWVECGTSHKTFVEGVEYRAQLLDDGTVTATDDEGKSHAGLPARNWRIAEMADV